MYARNTLIYANSRDTPIVSLCSSSQENLMENHCHPIVILFMPDTCCCLYGRIMSVEGIKKTRKFHLGKTYLEIDFAGDGGDKGIV